MEHITSRNNQLIKHIRKLTADRRYRRSSGLFFGEGPKLLAEALRAGTAIEAVVTAQGTGLPGLEGLRQVQVPADLLDSLCDTRSPQGVLFLAKMPELAPPERLGGDRWLILDGLQDPGNVGTIWRAADALGADGLILVGPCADPFSPKTVRATMGACFRLPVYEAEAFQLPGLLERSGLPLYAAALREDTADLREADLSRCAVAIGSEGRGLSPQVLEMSEKTLKIPMRDRCESLNAAVAAAVILWEMAR
ncbi:RNA methyltransferase [bacterium 1xD42-67]|nr:RNA methyltransferase [bacterium 1xD42-67]